MMEDDGGNFFGKLKEKLISQNGRHARGVDTHEHLVRYPMWMEDFPPLLKTLKGK